jgi:S1-C subfamily serine protease
MHSRGGMLHLLFALGVGDAILSRNIFCSGCNETRAPPIAIELYATVETRDPAWSRALLYDRASGVVTLAATGARAFGAQVARIARRRVWLVRDGVSFVLALDDARAPSPSDVHDRRVPPGGREQSVRLARDEVEAVLANPTALGVRALPTKDGLLLRKLAPGSPLRRTGLAEGDLVRAVDGTVIDGIEAGLALYQRLRHASRFSVEVVRDGRPLRLDVEIH